MVEIYGNHKIRITIMKKILLANIANEYSLTFFSYKIAGAMGKSR